MKKFTATIQEANALHQIFRGFRRAFTFKEGDYEVSDDYLCELSDENVAAVIAAHPDWSLPRYKKEHGEAAPNNNALNVIKINRLNLLMTLDDLDGEDHKAIHGEDCPLDKVKINQWRPDTCDCHTSYTWRKGADGRAVSNRHLPLRTHKRCDDHAHLTSHADHYNEVVEENMHKNVSVEALSQHIGEPPHRIGFRYEKGADGKRTLTLVHPTLSFFASAHAKDALSKHPGTTSRPISLSNQ